MEKKIVKRLERTDKKIEKKTDSGDYLQKIKDGVNKPTTLAINKRDLQDRGDAKKVKAEGLQIKYDATKINKAVEVNSKIIKQSTNGVNRIGVENLKNKSKFQSNTTDVKITNNINTVQDLKVKTTDNLRIAETKITGAKRISEKEPLRQTTTGRSDRETSNKTKEDGRNRAKIKEVITIPYTLVDDSLHDVNENIPLKMDRTKLSHPKPKSVTFKERNDSPRLAKRESKRPDSKSSWLKPNSGKKRRRKNSPSSTKTSINDTLATEVVKWSPSSVNNHTKPYYDAWVDRSLTAFSKCSEKERLKLEKEIIETLEYFKRPVSPELTYERMKDEAYTGRIKVRRG